MTFQNDNLEKIEDDKQIKILITGASGFIGSRLLNDLIDTNKK